MYIELPEITRIYLFSCEHCKEAKQMLLENKLSLSDIKKYFPIVLVKGLLDEKLAEEYFEGVGKHSHNFELYEIYVKVKNTKGFNPEYFKAVLDCCVRWKDGYTIHKGKRIRKCFKPELEEFVRSHFLV